MYGGRTSLFIGIVSAAIAILLATALGLLAGYYRGWADAVISRTLDVVWAFPVTLLAIALGLALATGGLQIGWLHLSGSSIWIPILIIGVVYTPYIARPIRAKCWRCARRSSSRRRCPRAQAPFGSCSPSSYRTSCSTIIVFFAISVANSMLLESVLSFLGVGVQPPNTSWGTMIAGGFELITSSPLLTVLPGAMLLLTVLSINVFADGLRDALDPKAKLRLEARTGMAEPEGTAV